MNELVVMHDQQVVTSSVQVADVFDKQHKHVMEAIQKKIDSAENSAQYDSMFTKGFYRDRSGKSNPMYYMNRDGFSFIAFGFTGRKADNFKLQYIEAFNKMEHAIKQRQPKLPESPREVLKLMFEANEETNHKVEKVDSRVTELEHNQMLAPGEYNYISNEVRRVVRRYCAAHPFITNRSQRSKLYHDISVGLNEVTHVKTRTQLRKKDFDIADEFINNWQPSTATVQIIKQLNGEAEGQTNLDIDKSIPEVN